MTDELYFSEQEEGPQARTEESIPDSVRKALISLIMRKLEDGSFAKEFPIMCSDSPIVCEANEPAFWHGARGEIPKLSDSLSLDLNSHSDLTEKDQIYACLDLLQFSAKYIVKPIKKDFHSYYRHYHLGFNRKIGLEAFVSTVNKIFSRNQIAFELTSDGIVKRTGPPGLREELRKTAFHTGDEITDNFLKEACEYIFYPKDEDRRRALDRLWDAFERIKTLESGGNKKEEMICLLDKSTPDQSPKFRQLLECEAKSLTDIGNDFVIRHSEKNKESLKNLEQVDYLFHRMFSFLSFVLIKTNRASKSSQ